MIGGWSDWGMDLLLYWADGNLLQKKKKKKEEEGEDIWEEDRGEH